MATIALSSRFLYETEKRAMKRDIPMEAGIGFTLLIAAVTFAVAVIAGIFLIYEPGLDGFRGQTQAQVAMIQGPDARRNAPLNPPPLQAP
jgi:hypothetical protein